MSKRRRTKKGRGKGSLFMPLALSLIFFLLGLLAGYLWDTFERSRILKFEPVPTVEPKKKRTESSPQIPLQLPEPQPKAFVAIIIDDIGYKREDVLRFSSIPYPLTLSVIPYTPFDLFSAKYAVEHGKSIMLHIPMEPNHTSEIIEKLERRTKGMILTSMSDDRLLEVLEGELRRVPHAVAANNHMGSKFTQNRRKMMVVLKFLKRHSLFFVDSRTSAKSVACSVGKSLGVVVLKRDIFLDNSKSKSYIEHQLDMLAAKALKKGYAIAIGHPHLATYQALVEKLPELEKRGIKVIPIERIYEEVLEGRYEACL